jgi:hypothetical protein
MKYPLSRVRRLVHSSWVDLEGFFNLEEADMGRHRLEAERCLIGVLSVVLNGHPWRLSPFDRPSSTTCRRRCHEWNDSGVLSDVGITLGIHQELKSRLRERGLSPRHGDLEEPP